MLHLNKFYDIIIYDHLVYRESPNRRNPLSATNTARAATREWKQKRRVTHKRLRDTARLARWAAITPLGLLFLAMVATTFGLINDPLPIYKGITILMAVAVALAVIGGCVRAGARVWQDAADDKKVRVQLVVAPLVTLLLALCGYGLAAGAIKSAFHKAFNFSFGGAEALLLVAVIVAIVLYALALWLLITLSLGVVRGLSMAIQTDDASSADDSDESDESEAKSPGSSRFVLIYVRAWFAWMGWLAFASIVAI